MLKTTKSITINGRSEIEVNGKMVQIASMSAYVSGDGNPSISKSIMDKELYAANKAQVNVDMSAFDAEAYQMISDNMTSTETTETE